MNKNIDRAVKLFRDAHGALLKLNIDERMEVGDNLARDFRKAGLLQNQSSSYDYTKKCTIKAGPMDLTIDANHGSTDVLTSAAYFTDDNGDMPF